ncbi:hypothetical protein K2173_000529 [Erythroxylum novogranatense]|uniref:Expansin-like EG45 domain-containing protein n=1 Tax=Erythroxylum novogranatense TaxID=1862640 RepID=A0AAV8SXQ8_9ROSI|nr:hypothetical protein K2173_000529 [Erythroxylum novogranatense]
MALLLQNSISIVALVTLLLSSGYSLKAYAQLTGNATHYQPPYMPSACYGYAEQGSMIAQVGEELWNNGLACGKHYQVTCLSGCRDQTVPVTVKIVEHCYKCEFTMILSEEAYDQISYTNGGGWINISYQESI